MLRASACRALFENPALLEIWQLGRRGFHLNAKFHAPCCLDGWVGYRGKCYYFSEAEGTWDSSQSFCSSLNASLAWIDTEKDLMFILRYKGVSEFWIGLKRVSAQTWQWVNGEHFNNLWKCFKDSWYFLKSSVRI
uniref:C-type lectin domain-containing protein n=1 Tax=Terrapene triunguis TaxID=2587831 RepID=A0A674J7R3_9SAUR